MADYFSVATGGAGTDFDLEEERAPQAKDMTRKQLDDEMDRRGLKSTGFNDDDQKILQRVLDAEFEANRAERAARRAEMLAHRRAEAERERAAAEAAQQLHDEQAAVAADPRVTFWMHLVQTNRTPAAMVMRVAPTAVRALVKALGSNTSLESLDLCSCDLKDDVGVEIGKLLSVNRTLKRLDLDFNQLGPRSLAAIAAGLASNTTLASLSLERNPLTGDASNEFSGIKSLASAMRGHPSLQHVNLYATGVGKEGGRALADAMRGTTTTGLTVLQLAPTDDIDTGDQSVITAALRDNARLVAEAEAGGKAARAAARKEAAAKRAEEEATAAAIAEAEWAAAQKAAREKAREDAEYAAFQRARKEELERELAEKERRDRLAAEAEAKKAAEAKGGKADAKGKKK